MIWAKLFYTLAFIPVQIEYKGAVDWKKRYIICSNHFSYLDIPMLGYTPTSFLFVGKSSLGKIPLFGYMFKRLHITVDRENFKDRYNSLQKASTELDTGRSVVIFPEGGITSKRPPEMSRFKEGAFKLAVEKQIPILPVTIPYNWIILPGHGDMLVTYRKAKVVYHEPIDPSGLEIDELKTKTREVIRQELDLHFPDES